jgi:opacity protein-like surface antigen
MKRVWTIAPLLAGLVATPAYAQGFGISPRAEVRVGYDEVRPKITIMNESRTGNYGVSGIAYGAEVGVDLNITETMFAGIYGGVELSNVDGCKSGHIIPTLHRVDFPDQGCADAGTNYTAGLRLGVDAGGGRAYAKGGWSRGRFGADYRHWPVPATGQPVVPVVRFDGRETVSGWHIGAGFELDITRNFYVKAEYVHHSYNAFAGQGLFVNDQARIRRHQLMGGIGFRLGAAPPPMPLPPPPPPPPPPPATRTCPDGTVVLATEPCPAPPPPPPPPPPMPERG